MGASVPVRIFLKADKSRVFNESSSVTKVLLIDTAIPKSASLATPSLEINILPLYHNYYIKIINFCFDGDNDEHTI